MRILPVLLTLILATASASPSLAEDAPPPAPISTPAGLVPLDSDDLQAVDGLGTETIQLTEQQLTATSTGNTVIASTLRSGDVAFSASALTGFSGVGNFVINTGNNNNLQGAISVNIITNAPL